MAIDPLSGTGAAQQTRAQNSLSELGADYQRFLTLLTAQISNQNPLEPMDSTTFITQLAQLSQVEQSVVTNDNLETVQAQLTSVAALAGVGMIGRTVTAPSNLVELQGGSARFEYRLAEEAASVSAIIRAEDGTVVREIRDLPVSPEELHGVDWNGMDSAGLPVPDATFEVEILARKADNTIVQAISYVKSGVSGMTFENGLSNLTLANGATVPMGSVEAIE